jgi:hypothetical protein
MAVALKKMFLRWGRLTFEFMALHWLLWTIHPAKSTANRLP